MKRRREQEREEADAREQADARREALLAELKAREAADRMPAAPPETDLSPEPEPRAEPAVDPPAADPPAADPPAADPPAVEPPADEPE